MFKGPLSGVRQFLTIESPLKVMKNAFHFTLKAFFVLQIFAFLSWLFGYVEKRLDKKAMFNFKIYDVTDWTANNFNTHITQYLDKFFGQLIKYNMKNGFLEKSSRKWGRETSSKPFFVFRKSFMLSKNKWLAPYF